MLLQTLEDGERQGALRAVALVGLRAHVRLVALQQAPHARQEPLELAVLETVVPVQLFLDTIPTSPVQQKQTY